jgi:hypothetical protein
MDVTGTVKKVVAVNLRYTSLALNLAKEYIKAFEGAVREGVASADEAAATGEGGTQKPARRPPLLLVGELDQEATGAFALNNTSDRDLNVALIAQGELDPAQVQITPASVKLAPGTSTIIRLKVKLGDALEEGRDYLGAVLAPGLSAQVVEFVVRRLPTTAEKTAPPGSDAPASTKGANRAP